MDIAGPALPSHKNPRGKVSLPPWWRPNEKFAPGKRAGAGVKGALYASAPIPDASFAKKKKDLFFAKRDLFSPKFFFILRKAETPSTPHRWTAA